MICEAGQIVLVDWRDALPKVHINSRLAAEVVEGIRTAGHGYNARVERGLKEALRKGEL